MIEDVSPGRYRVVLEKLYDGRGSYGMARVLLGLMLLAAAESLGWPEASRVHDAFDRYLTT